MKLKLNTTLNDAQIRRMSKGLVRGTAFAEFFADPENRKRFEKWQEEKEAQK